MQPTVGQDTQRSLRNRPVSVTISGGGVYLCNRADILEHLPNTRHYSFGRYMDPDEVISHQNQPEFALDAVHHIFRGLEAYRLNGTPLLLFDKARDMLLQDNAGAYESAFEFFCGVCATLDSEWGLGCSDALLQQIDDFAIDLMESHEPGFFTPELTAVFFMSYSKVFQATTPRHMDTLRTLWNSVPAFFRASLMMDFTAELLTMPARGNAAAMFRAMRDMSMT